MDKYFEELNPIYAGRKLNEDYEGIGNATLAKYGLAFEYGDHQAMIRVVSRPYMTEDEFKELNLNDSVDSEDDFYEHTPEEMLSWQYEAYACIMWTEPEEEAVDNIHLEHSIQTKDGHFIQNQYIMTDEEYIKAVEILKEVLDAIIN